MASKKIIYIIPGFEESPRDRAYQALSRMLKKQGFETVLISIPWKNTTISQNSEYFLNEFKKVNSKEKYILGFSLGAMIAFIASTKVEVAGLILCSLSPYFLEDLPKIGANWKASTIARYQDFASHNCGRLAKELKAKKIIMFYGAEELKSLIKRVKKAYEQIDSKKKYLFSVSKTEHEIGSRKYLAAINEATKFLN